MTIWWGRNAFASPLLHAIDVDKRDGNPFSLCGGVLLRIDTAKLEMLATFRQSREGRCQKCFKIASQRMQKVKKQRGVGQKQSRANKDSLFRSMKGKQ